MRHATLLYSYPTSPHATVITWTEHGECNLPSSAPARKTERTPTPSHFIRRQKASKQDKPKQRYTGESHLHHTYTCPLTNPNHRGRQNRIIDMQYLKRSEAKPNPTCLSASPSAHPAHMTISIPRKGNPEGSISCLNRKKATKERLVEENATKRQDRRTPHCLLYSPSSCCCDSAVQLVSSSSK
jgi:hypothetical protein